MIIKGNRKRRRCTKIKKKHSVYKQDFPRTPKSKFSECFYQTNIWGKLGCTFNAYKVRTAVYDWYNTLKIMLISLLYYIYKHITCCRAFLTSAPVKAPVFYRCMTEMLPVPGAGAFLACPDRCSTGGRCCPVQA